MKFRENTLRDFFKKNIQKTTQAVKKLKERKKY